MCTGTGKRWESLRSSKKYQNLARWFNSILAEYDGVLHEVTATYMGKKGSGKPTVSKVKEQHGSNANLAKVNGDSTDKEKSGSRPTFEVDLPEAEDGKVRLRFAPEPSGY